MKTSDDLCRAALEGEPLPLGVIDMHAHMGPLGMFYVPDCDAAAMVKIMDRTGVIAAATSANAAWASDMRYGNDMVARAVRDFPGRFLPYCVINPQYTDEAAGELLRCFDELGFGMIKVHPAWHGVKLTDKRYELVFEFAAERRAPILTHTWIDDPTCSPELGAEVARRHPEVEFIWGHSGGTDVRPALREGAGLENVHLELCCSWVYAGVVEFMVERVGAERILFGSDFSFIALPQQLGKVVFADITPAEKRLILRENAIALLSAAGIDLLGR